MHLPAMQFMSLSDLHWHLGEVLEARTVELLITQHRYTFKHYSQTFGVNCPIKHALAHPKNVSSAWIFRGARVSQCVVC
jgi:hypothetical protein